MYSVILLGRRFATPLIVWLKEHISVSARHANSLVLSSWINSDPSTRGRGWQCHSLSLHESHPGWQNIIFQSCGYPYGQRGRIFLFYRNGFSSLTSILDLVKQFLSLCMNHAIKFEVRHFPGSLDVFADTGSRDKPSVTDYCLDPDSGSDCFGLEGFVQT